jgi:hypothetical protein
MVRPSATDAPRAAAFPSRFLHPILATGIFDLRHGRLRFGLPKRRAGNPYRPSSYRARAGNPDADSNGHGWQPGDAFDSVNHTDGNNSFDADHDAHGNRDSFRSLSRCRSPDR